MKKKAAAVVLASVMAASIVLGGCGNKASETGNTSGSVSASAEPTEYTAKEMLESTDYDVNDYVKLGKWKKIKVEVDKSYEMTDENIKEAGNNIISSTTYYEEVDDAAAEKDKVNIDFEGKMNGETFDNGSSSNYDLVLGSGSFIDGFESGLVGHKNGRYYDTFRNRCMFPILNLKGKPVAFGGRVMDDSKPKYLNSPETPIFNKRQLLFALYQALPEIRRTRQVIMVEGYMDAISLHAHGVTNAVASLGTAFTIEQARLLKRYADEVVFSYDMDAAGQNATRRALEIAGTTGLKMRVLHLSEGKDPDEFVNKYGGEAYKEAVAQAIPALDYLFKSLLETHDRTSLEGQHLILNDMFTVLSARGDSFEFNTYIQKMARVLKVDEGLVRNEARLFARKNNPRVYISQRVQNITESVEEDKEKEKIEALEKAIIRYCFITGRRPDGWEYLSTHTFSNAFCGRMYGILATLYAAGQPWTKENAQGLMEHEDMEYLAPLLVKEGRIAISPWEEYIRPLVILTLQKEYRVHTEKAAEMLRQGKKQEAAEEQLLCLKINRQIRNLRKG